MSQQQKEIYLAGGCFWGLEKYVKQIYGVINTSVGYANGKIKDPTYEEVCTQATGFAETVYISYDPSLISLVELLTFYQKAIDPTSKNKQGNDKGNQYRTGIYYTQKEDRPIIDNFIQKLQENYQEKIVIEVEPLKNYYQAEEYHQNYLGKHPGGYCHIPKEIYEYVNQESQKKKKQRQEKLQTTHQYENILIAIIHN